MKENRRRWLRAIWPLIAVLSHQSGEFSTVVTFIHRMWAFIDEAQV